MLAQIEEHLKAVQDARKNADSEALLAFNAKKACEDHATAISTLKGTAESESAWLSTTRKTVEGDAQMVSAARRETEGSAIAAAAAKDKSETHLAGCKTNLEKTESTLTSTEAEYDRVKTVKQEATDVATDLARTKGTVDGQAATVAASYAQVADAAAKVQTDSKAVADGKARASELVTQMESVTETSKAARDRVDQYETTLKLLQDEYNRVREQIEALLPGSTSAGLASAFQDQKKRFDNPQSVWLWTFIVSIVALVGVGIWHLVAVNEAVKAAAAGSSLTWDLVLRHLANRLVLVVPLLWIALVASRNYSNALRLQEDYAFKEAISRSFEGYRTQMTSLAMLTDHKPLVQLCENVLRTLSERPGRLYEGKHDDVTPLSTVTKSIGDLTKQVKELVSRSENQAAE